MNTLKTNLAIVDDEILIRQGLELLINNFEDFQVSHQACDGSSFLSLLEKSNDIPDIVLIDIKMSPMDGFETVKILNEIYPTIKSIVLSSYYQETLLAHMIELGVSGFLPKNCKKETLYTALNDVKKMGVYFSKEDHLMLRKHIQNKTGNIYFTKIDQLSKRETEVVELICSELTNQEIADKLFISKRTVESHRERIIQKLGVKNSVGIVIYAMVNQLVKPPTKFYV